MLRVICLAIAACCCAAYVPAAWKAELYDIGLIDADGRPTKAGKDFAAGGAQQAAG